MFTKIRDAYGNVRRHKILFGLLFVLSALCYHMFTQNYSIQQPIISKRAETFQDVFNERASCLTQLDEAHAAEVSANADILK